MLFSLATAVAAGLAVLVYWRIVHHRNADSLQARPTALTIALFTLGFALCSWSMLPDRPAYSYTPRSNPVAIAIAFDLSPSMLAVPDPLFDRSIQPRYVRAREALLELFRVLQERRINVLVSLVGFTRNAEVLMGWDYNVSQIHEILQYGLSPDLFSSSGTSIEAAVDALVDVFGMLPKEFREASHKIAILASDGEDTLPRSFLGYALEELATNSFDVIALQSGLLDASEGVPRYGQIGEFLGFEVMGGELYTVPDVEAMAAISNATTERGLYVRAEDPAAVERMLQFMGHENIDSKSPDRRLIAALGLFAVVGLFCARVLN
jgi:hypothetical protein